MKVQKICFMAMFVYFNTIKNIHCTKYLQENKKTIVDIANHKTNIKMILCIVKPLCFELLTVMPHTLLFSIAYTVYLPFSSKNTLILYTH